jgi:hypothetical protein
MGSWSVYCSISNIAIRSGQKCVLLPLKKSQIYSEHLPYIPATLPIFGEYDDYGGLEKIVKDKNTELISNHFGVSIKKFCYYFTRGIIADDEPEFPAKLKKVKELKDWKFMFIDRKVYDFMSTNISDDQQGDLYFGNKAILQMLGFKSNGVNKKNPTDNKERYKYEWKLGDKKFYTDGTWLYYGKESIYDFDSLSKYIDIPEDKLWMREKNMWQLWEHLGEADRLRFLGGILGHSVEDYYIKKLVKLIGGAKLMELPIADKYMLDLDAYGESLSELVTVRHSLHAMSGSFLPYLPYITPQDGAVEHHQKLLDKFSEINRSYRDEYN